ncbi:hypothetical protein PRNP1_010244 [Phytophthora ramorum]
MFGGGHSDDERDAPRPPPAELQSRADADRVLRSFGPSFASAALAFLSEAVDSSVETRPEQLQVLERIVDRAAREAQAGRRRRAGESQGDSGLQRVLVAAFQAAARQLSATDMATPESERWLRCCEQVIDVLCSGVAAGGEAMHRKLIWRRLLCCRWDAAAAGLALVLLLHQAQQKWTSAWTQADGILQVIAFAYAHMSSDLKEFCMKQVEDLVRTVVDEGPSYQFTPRMALRLQLLGHLTAVCFLDDDLDVMPWINEFFHTCFECCGVVLQLLDEQSKADGGDSDGMVRMLDMCLLVLKAGFDYFETRRSDIATLLELLAPVVVGALSQLVLHLPVSAEAWTNSPDARSLETSLRLLAKMGAVIEDSQSDALTKVFDKIFAPGTALALISNRPELLSTCFDAIDQLLAQPSVAERMSPSLNVLLQTGDLKVSREQYVVGRHGRATESSGMEMARQGASFRYAKTESHDEDDPPEPKAEAVASLLSGMDLHDATQGKLVGSFREDEADEMTESVPDQPCIEVVRPGAPQWFDEGGSDDDGSELEADADVPLATDESKSESSQVQDRASTTVPQWFDDGEEDEEDIDLLQCALDGASDCPGLSLLLPPAPQASPRAAFDLGRVVDDDAASEDGSANTEVMSWSDCSRSRSSSLASLPS